jgi:hypothetical protein
MRLNFKPYLQHFIQHDDWREKETTERSCIQISELSFSIKEFKHLFFFNDHNVKNIQCKAKQLYIHHNHYFRDEFDRGFFQAIFQKMIDPMPILTTEPLRVIRAPNHRIFWGPHFDPRPNVVYQMKAKLFVLGLSFIHFISNTINCSYTQSLHSHSIMNITFFPILTF